MARPTAADSLNHGIEPTRDRPDGLSLFSSEGTLENFPGAVLIAGPNGMVLRANPAAGPIASLLTGAECEELRGAVASAMNGAAAQVNPLLVPSEGGKGCGRAYDVAVLPWGDGTTVLLLGRDITLERSLRAALIESRQRYKDLVEATSDLVWETDADGRFVFVTSRGALGFGASDLVGTLASDLLLERGAGEESPFATRVRVQGVEVWVGQPDREPACLLMTAIPLFGPDGEWRGARGLCRNITAERSHETQLAVDRNRERLLAYILGILRDEMDPARMLQAAAGALVPALPATGACIYRLDCDGELVRAAQAGQLPPEDLLEAVLQRVGEGDDEVDTVSAEGSVLGKTTHFQGERNGFLCLWRRGAASQWKGDDRILLGEIVGQIGLTNQQLTRQKELEQLSSTDPLTGLLNRRSFMAEIERRFSRRARWVGGAALYFIDLDNFKAVNDRHGHQRGDLALVTVARILRDQTRFRDLVARLGGDEFALFIEDITIAAAGHKGEEILEAARGIREFSGDSEHPLGLSIGVSFCPPDHDGVLDGLIDRADRAMYEVKRHGKGGTRVAPIQPEESVP